MGSLLEARSSPLMAADIRSSVLMCLEADVAPPGVLPEGSIPKSSLFLAGGSRVLHAFANSNQVQANLFVMGDWKIRSQQAQ